MWLGYYYSPYPTVAGDYLVYKYLHSDALHLGDTNLNIYARSRGQSTQAETALVVGAYNPFPCDQSLTLYDLYSAGRELWVDDVAPALLDGTPVKNCTIDFWRNLILYGVLNQRPDKVILSADMEPSIEANFDPTFLSTISTRLNEHSFSNETRSIANVIVDTPKFKADVDGFSNDEFLEMLSLTILPLISDGLEAAGMQTVITYDEQWSGGNADLLYIVTAGGNEDNTDEGAMGAPYWSSAQDFPDPLYRLLDSSEYSGPVFIHPVWGIPNTTNWKKLRRIFGLPDSFSFKNVALTQDTEAQTSLLSSHLVDEAGETFEDAQGNIMNEPTTPETGVVLGQSVKLQPYFDTSIGQTANVIGSNEVSLDNVIVEGTLLVNSHDGTGGNISVKEVATPYLITNGNDRYLWTVNQLHLEAYSYIMSQVVARALEQTSPLAAPAYVQMLGGEQIVALAYDQTELSFNMPFDEGTMVRIRIYDYKGVLSSDETVKYSAPLVRTLGKRSLIVAEAAN